MGRAVLRETKATSTLDCTLGRMQNLSCILYLAVMMYYAVRCMFLVSCILYHSCMLYVGLNAPTCILYLVLHSATLG